MQALREQVRRLEEEAAKRGRLGRKPQLPTTADALLISRVCAARGWSRTMLAMTVGVTGGVLSGSHCKLSARVRALVQALDTGC